MVTLRRRIAGALATLTLGSLMASTATAQMVDVGTLANGHRCVGRWQIDDQRMLTGVCRDDTGSYVSVYRPPEDVVPHVMPTLSPIAPCDVVDLSPSGVVAANCKFGTAGQWGPVRWQRPNAPQRLAPPAGDGRAEAVAINRGGAIAGVGVDGDGTSHGTLWLSATGMALPAPGLLGLTATECRASALNDMAPWPTVVGVCLLDNGRLVAVRWTNLLLGIYQAVRLAPPAGAGNCAASLVNRLGQVAGVCEDGAGRTVTTVWPPGLSAPITLSGRENTPVAITDRGLIAGHYVAASGHDRAFTWRPGLDGDLQDIGSLGGDWTRVADVAPDGTVAGTAETALGAPHAFVRPPAGGLVDLGTLGGFESAAHGINAQGCVTGVSELSNGLSRAFVANCDGSGHGVFGTGTTTRGARGTDVKRVASAHTPPPVGVRTIDGLPAAADCHHDDRWFTNDDGALAGRCRDASGTPVVYYRRAGTAPLVTLSPPYADADCDVIGLTVDGEVVGANCQNDEGSWRGVRWITPDAPRILASDISARPTIAKAMNTQGVVVGTTIMADGTELPRIWRAEDDEAEPLPVPSGTTTECAPNALNDSETPSIVGICNGSGGGGIAVVWTPSSPSEYHVARLKLRDTADNCTPVAINTDGKIAGTCEGPDGAFRATFWASATADPIVADGRITRAVAMNQAGVIAGNLIVESEDIECDLTADDPEDPDACEVRRNKVAEFAFLWDVTDGAPVVVTGDYLDNPDELSEASDYRPDGYEVTGLGEDHTVIGVLWNERESTSTAFVERAEQGVGFHALGDLGGSWSVASHISPGGCIVGLSETAAGTIQPFVTASCQLPGTGAPLSSKVVAQGKTILEQLRRFRMLEPWALKGLFFGIGPQVEALTYGAFEGSLCQFIDTTFGQAAHDASLALSHQASALQFQEKLQGIAGCRSHGR